MNPRYLRLSETLNKHLDRYGLTEWVDKLPPELRMAILDAMKELIKDKETENES